ncbi:MAG: hypothetical protein ACKO90_38115, partial [Microcystis panniformis]
AQIGSRKISGADDYSSQSWGIFAPNLTIYGFEADADECKRMNQNLKERNISHQEKHIPIALSNTQGKSQLYVTKEKMCSSLYEPNQLCISFSQFSTRISYPRLCIRNRNNHPG